MKITFDIDCTPAEARSFFGLPDVKPMQDALLQKVEDRLGSYLDAMSVEALVKSWLPASVQGIENLQKMFWSTFAESRPPTRSKSEK